MEKTELFEIEERARRAGEEVQQLRGSTGQLSRELSSGLRLMRSVFLSLQHNETAGWERWLSGHFDHLEGHLRQTRRDLAAFRYQSGGCWKLFRVLAELFDGKLSITQETLQAVLRGYGRAQELRERQLDFVYPAMHCVLLFCALRACGDGMEDAQREQLLQYAVEQLPLLHGLDYERLAETCSPVEACLQQDPTQVYSKMASESRRVCRQITARIARMSGESELQVAQNVLNSALGASDTRRRQVGYHLLENDPQRRRAKRCGEYAMVLTWLLPLAVCVLLWYWLSGWTLLLYPLLVELCWTLSCNWVLRHTPPMQLFRMAPEQVHTKVVAAVCTLLPPAERMDQLRAHLEQLYVSARMEGLSLCLLADLSEERRPHMPQDEANLQAAQRMIRQLNQQYGAHFLLFVRRRIYNKTQHRYTGWERKRGALIEFVRFLKGGETSLLRLEGSREWLEGARYLLALDSDTELTLDAVSRLVATAEYPLNRPVLGAENTVIQGYGILVPRLGCSLKSARKTRFSGQMAGAGGISGYDQPCGSFYQDVFGSTIFCGKGLIDFESFYAVLNLRFPEGQILSHDILEGIYLRTGLVSDAEFLEGVPASAGAWFARAHRWLRGDWQNLPFLGHSLRRHGTKCANPIGALGRWQLTDNLRRALLPVFALLAVVLSCFAGSWAGWPCTAALLALVLPQALVMLQILLQSVWCVCTQRYFSGALALLREQLGHAIFAVVSAAQSAGVSLDAMARALWRLFVSHRGLLEWTTAAQSEKGTTPIGVWRHGWCGWLLGLVLLVFAPHWFTKLWGAAFLFYPALAIQSARPLSVREQQPSTQQREQLLGWCGQMFRFYEDYATEAQHYLPPDNVQLFPREAVDQRTSPTNIGMMLLSYLAARDFHLLDSAGLYLRVARVLDTLEQLETSHGNLYNWYATDTLEILPDGFVSAVDSGNLLCALVTLREGLLEYATGEPMLLDAAQRIQRLLDAADLSVFYHPQRRLFSIGLDQKGRQSSYHYDFLMSEARALSYYAIATRQVPLRHWRSLNRSMGHSGRKTGLLSWTGTMFEYLMPHLFLPVYEGSLLAEAVRYAIVCQQQRAVQTGLPWGISESAYFLFDGQLHYQYKAHGVQALGVKRGLDDEYVVAPYATFLALPFDLESGMQNLFRLENLGLVGPYGFYEAADFTPERTNGAAYAVVRSYMAHHVGMSMVACANLLLENKMQKRFLRNRAMRSVRELLQEKISKEMVVYHRMKPKETSAKKQENPPAEKLPVERFSGAGLLENGSLCHPMGSDGAGWLRYGALDVTRRPEDALLHPQGIWAVARLCGETICATAAPFFQQGVTHSCSLEADGVAYHAERGLAAIEQRFRLDQALPLEACTVTLYNRSDIKAVAELLFYLEPVLSTGADYEAHPAFSKLFIQGERDPLDGGIYFTRRQRDARPPLWLAVGLREEVSYHCSLKREEMTPYPDGLENLLQFDTLPFSNGSASPDGCCALRLSLLLPAQGQEQVTFLLALGSTREACASLLATARARERFPAARALLRGQRLDEKLGARLLPALLFGGNHASSQQARAENTRGQDALWSVGISGDLPLVVYNWEQLPDTACLAAYCSVWETMRQANLPFDFCVLAQQPIALPLPEGVHLLDNGKLDGQICTMLYAAACWIAGEQPKAPAIAHYGERLKLRPAAIPQGDRFDLVGGAYADGRFYVERVTPLPFSHILANGAFGCLLQDASLGCSWWGNAHECRITPWRNDLASGCNGERLLLRTAQGTFDLCDGARASFSPQDACYQGSAGEIATKLCVEIGKGGCKLLTLSLENQGEEEQEISCLYLLEPVLGVSRRTAQYLQMEQAEGCLVLHNPYQTNIPCYAAIGAPQLHPSFSAGAAALLAGDWSARELLPEQSPLVGMVVRKKLLPHRKETLQLRMTAAATRRGALALMQAAQPQTATAPVLEISTPNEPLNRFFNTFLRHQVVAGRLLGRCAFYQCSGAYGFRDQLQDAGACLLTEPVRAKVQILRCCGAQFPEGDVLHWWHPLPDGKRGVRTRFSDDLLWLPLLVGEYLQVTGDESLLDIPIRYCRGELLKEHEQECYQTVQPDLLCEPVFCHCIRAIDRGYRIGAHGIPLIGCGDWNDGFSKVGVEGKGESVWLGMLLAMVLDLFAPLCDMRNDSYRAGLYRANAAALRRNIDQHCWDGQWYLRAFYDDGAAMGGQNSEECSIDLLPQSFSVLAQMPDKQRVSCALDSALEQLIDKEYRLIKLFAPPFAWGEHDPGYIKAYPAGIRENGGQYTHAAVWLAIALLRAGRTKAGWKLLDWLNPSSRCTDAKLAQAFCLEPYYLPADIYTCEGAYGHGGWSIYTGAAGWYWCAVVQELLGIQRHGKQLELHPAIPDGWNGFSAVLRIQDCELSIKVRRGDKPELLVDGEPAQTIPLDAGAHEIQLTF
ncbi:MAG: DUF3131 domain-containing protein [Anaerotruncus sp.]|nr:DUF3131 domain-containing protein [Anaerotruncus sp.]